MDSKLEEAKKAIIYEIPVELIVLEQEPPSKHISVEFIEIPV